MVKKVISIVLISEVAIILSAGISFSFFINVQVAFLSAFCIILGSSYAYKKMIAKQVDTKEYEDKRDILDTIEDPYELYEDTDEKVEEVLDLKQIVKEEKAKIKTLSMKSMKHGIRGSSSFLRLVPYAFLVLGFIALENNRLLDIAVYLPSLLFGIIVGALSSKEIFKED